MSDSIYRKIYNYFLERWLLTTFVITAPSYWFIILRYIGDNLKLIDSNGGLTLLGHILTWPLLLMSIIFTALRLRSDRQNHIATNNGAFLLEKVLQSINASTQKKIRRFQSVIKENNGNENTAVFHRITQPRVQIENILENLQVTLSDIFGIGRDNIGLSVIYKTNDKWNWLTTMNISDDLDLDTLVNDDRTTFRNLLDKKRALIFYPDKRIAIEREEFLPGPIDEKYNNIGSVLCSRIGLSIGHDSLTAVLSITTYGKQLCAQDPGDIDKVKRSIVANFEPRIQNELALLYLKEEMISKCTDCKNNDLISESTIAAH